MRGSGFDTWAGEKVNADSAMKIATVYACVKIISEGLAKLPFHILQRDRKDPRKSGLPNTTAGMEIYDLLHYEPNHWQTSYEFREQIIGHASLRGNGYAFANKVRGRVRELLPLHPDSVHPRLDPKWIVVYEITNTDGSTEERTKDEVFHVKGFGTDQLVGYSPIEFHRQTLGESVAQQRHSANLWGNRAKPGGLLTHPSKLSKEAGERLQEQMDAKVNGENSGKTLILEEAMDWKQIGLTSVDAQFIETRKLTRSDIAVIWGVKPHLIGDLDRAIQSNIEEQSRSHVVDTLLPWIIRFEEATRRDLLKGVSRDLFAKLSVEGLLRGSSKDRSEFYRTMLELGVYTRNEVRDREDLNPLPGLDEPLTPLNLTQGNEDANSEEPDQ